MLMILVKLSKLLIKRLWDGFPDTMAFASQSQIFRSLGGGRRIDVDIQGNDVDILITSSTSWLRCNKPSITRGANSDRHAGVNPRRA